MKKRVLSMLLAFILCFSTLPMTAFAQEAVQEADAVTEQEEQQEAAPAAEPEEQQVAVPAAEQKEAEAAAAPGEETPSDKSTTAATPGTEDPTAGEAPDTVKSTGESISDNDAGTQDTAADDEKKAAMQKVQALINALPETVTVENAESVSAQLEAIDEAMESLTEDQIAELDMTRLHAISEAMNALMMVAEQHTHCICGMNHHEVGGHREESMTTFTQKLWMDVDTLKIDDAEVDKKTGMAGYNGECYVLPLGDYYLDSDLTLSCPIYIGQEVKLDTNAKVVNLCLNGNSITANGDFDTIILFCDNSNAKMALSLTDCQGTGKITHADGKNGCGVYVDAFHRATFNMYGGSITGNNGHASSSNTSTPDGGGVYMNNTTHMSDNGGIFNMYGGTISDNSASNGGGLFMCNNVGNIFRMYGGSITGNKATGMGGGVYSAGGEITMTGGAIKNNNASQGGGMYKSGGSSVFFTMSGGSITGNKATQKGGGVYVIGTGNFKISGSVEITGNTKDSNETNNVELAAGKTITIQSGLAEDASIGVTTEKKPGTGDYSKVASGAEGYFLTEVDANHFFSDVDQTNYTIQRTDNKLILTNTGDDSLHRHPICGETCTHKNADGTFQHKDVYWEATSTLTSDMPAGYYYLTSNVTLTQSWNPAEGMVLDLNGHDIIMNDDDYVISKYTSGAFTLTDCMGGKDTYGKITHGSNHKGGGIELYTTAYASYTNSFVMYGGSITGNTGSYPGVYLGYSSYRSRTFTMYGGEITNNKNTSTSNSFKGGGVYVGDSKNIFTMTGGKITGNQTATYGGGVYVEGQSNFIVSGDAQITGNYKTDGTSTTADNVYLQSVVDGTQKQASIQVNGALSNNASISVNAGTIDAGSYKIVAQGSKYTLTNDDLQRFTSDDAGYTTKLVNNSITFTNGTPHEHPICGKTDCNDGHSNALWLPLTYENNQLKYGGTTASHTTTKGPGHVDADVWDTITEYTLPEGNYYLSGDITIDGTIKISGNVNLCLNGHTISTNSNKVSYAVIYTQYWKLSICDCTGKGSLKVPNNGVTNGIQTSADINDERGILYLYGGTISGGNCGVNVKGQLYLYGGTITGNSCGVSDAQKITIGGDVKITNNTCKNVELSSGKTITIDKSLTEDAKIGITTFSKPSKTTPSIQIAAGAGGSLKYTDIFKSDITDYVITQTGTDLYLGIHQHNWTYSAEGATITIRCNAENCNLGTDFATTYTVTAPTDLTYSGSDKPATVEVSENTTDLTLPEKPTVTYQKQNGNEFETLNGVPTDVGTYRASIRMGDQTAGVTYKIVSKKVTNPTIEVTGTYTYDGTAKTPAVVVKDGINVIPSTEYSVSYENSINAGAATVTITDVDGGNYNVSGSTTFTIDKATITVTPTAGQTTIYGMSDPTLEYSSSGAMNGEKPAFAGALSRSVGKDTGKYDITLGTLALADNSAGNFRAENYELKLADTPVQFTIVPKTLSAEDLEFITDSPITKTYDGTTACDTATVRIKSRAIAYDKDDLPTVKGTYAYNSANVTEANEVIFTSEVSENQNYILPAGLELGHAANITKADQAALTITSTSATYGTDLTLTVDGGSGNGALTYTVENGTGVATISGSTLQPVRAGQVTVQATKAGDDNYYDVQSARTTITIDKGNYPGTVSKTINIIKNRSGEQMGTLTAADFFPEGKAPASAQISGPENATGKIVNVTRNQDLFKGYILNYITVDDNITSETDQTCTVTSSSTNYEDIEATLIFHPTDKTTVTIEGLTYTDKTYDGDAIQPTGTLLVTGGSVPTNDLEVTYTGTGNTTYNSPIAPKDAGTYEVTYKVADSNENYTGEVTYTFTISPKNVTAGMIGTIAAQEYTGSAITPEPVVKDGGVALSLGTDFDLRYDNNINAGENTATVTINGKGNYTGTASRTFTISPKDIKGAAITLQADSLGYTGLMQEVQITSVILGQVTLTANDYDIVNDSNKQISANDSITLTIAGKGNYTGTATTTWKITKATPELGNFDVTPDLSQKQTYDGKPKEVTAKTKNGVIDMGDVTVYYEGISGTTYTRSETAPTNAGSYKVILSVVEGKNYTAAEIEAGTLTIDKADLTVEDVTEFFEYTKTGTQTINLAELVPGATNYAPGTYTDDNGILTGDLTIDATGLMKFTLSALTIANIDNKVTVPVTITSENYKNVTVNVTIYISPEYRIIDGAGSSWTQNTTGTVVIRGNGEYNRFRAVKVDGKVIAPANYDKKEGSTIITLKAEYLKTLATGSHTFAIVWDNGIAGTSFTVAANTSGNHSGNNNNNDSNHGSDNSGNNDSGNTAANTAAAPAQELDKVPATGDPFGIWLTLFAISLIGLVGMLARRKKN